MKIIKRLVSFCLATSCLSCVTIGRGDLEYVVDNPNKPNNYESLSKEPPNVIIDQIDDTVDIKLISNCISYTDKTFVYSKENKNPVRTAVLGIGGTLLISFGIVTIVQANTSEHSFIKSCEDSLCTGLTQEAATIIGAVSAASGLPMVLASLFYITESFGHEEINKKQTAEEKTKPCQSLNGSYNMDLVHWRKDGKPPIKYHIGLVTKYKYIDLENVVFNKLAPPFHTDETVDVLINDVIVGNVSLKFLYDKFSTKDWNNGKLAKMCTNPIDENSCDALSGFLNNYPGGPFYKEGKMILEKSKEMIDKFRADKAAQREAQEDQRRKEEEAKEHIRMQRELQQDKKRKEEAAKEEAADRARRQRELDANQKVKDILQ